MPDNSPVTTLWKWTAPSAPDEAIRAPSGVKATEVAQPGCRRSTLSGSPLTVLRDADRAVRARGGDQRAVRTEHRGEHGLAVGPQLADPAEGRHVPQAGDAVLVRGQEHLAVTGLNATARTAAPPGLRERAFLPFASSHSATAPSRPPVASSVPSGLNARS